MNSYLKLNSECPGSIISKLNESEEVQNLPNVMFLSAVMG